ncbi:MAG: UbiA family prenyltransferase [Candidatus Methanofastidiosa archaeon]|nr:UbiA family prenyltransferase [Candidatus Methanofastidiosa archaeon]
MKEKQRRREPNKMAKAYLIATRPQFLFAYLMLSLGGIVIGVSQGFGPVKVNALVMSMSTVIIAAIGIHYRDEASDWDKGYDREVGGMGVIRNGTLSSPELRRWGVLLNLVAFALIAYQVIIIPELLIVGLPASIILMWPNYLTEEVTLGHEAIISFSFWATMMWVYLGQGWDLTMPTMAFSVFAFMLAFAITPYQDIGDYEADRKSGKKTLTVRLGIDGVGQLSIFIVLVSLFFLYYSLIILP